MLKSKKANMWASMMTPFIFIFIFGILTFIGYALFTEFYLGFQESGMLTTEGEQVFEDMGNGIKMFDWIAVIVVVALIISATYFLSLTNHSPVEYVAAWIMCPFIGFIGYVFNYIFIQFISQDILNVVYLVFPKITILATNAHWIALGTFLISQAVMYIKSKKDNQGSEPI
jgi:hypothetical protein